MRGAKQGANDHRPEATQGHVQPFVADFRSFYGPTVKAFEALDEHGGAALTADLARLVRRWDRNDGGSIAIPTTYLESILTLRP